MLNFLCPHAAAIIKTKKITTLLVADPHIGWETELQKKGIHIPSQTKKMLDKMVSILSEYKPDVLTILGDIKCTVASSKIGELQDIPAFFNLLQRHVSKISIVQGNHDANIKPLLPKSVELISSSGTVIGDVGVFHGHKWPSPSLLGCKTLVMGHLHPVVVFHDPTGFKITRQVWIQVKCEPEGLGRILLLKNGIKIQGSVKKTLKNFFNVELKTTELCIMPSFNDFLGGKAINEAKNRREIRSNSPIGPILRLRALDVEETEIFLLDGTYLGKLNQLKNL